MENIKPHTQADHAFIDYIRSFTKKVDREKLEHADKNDQGRALRNSMHTMFSEFYTKIKERRIVPLLGSINENDEISQQLLT